MTNFKVGDVVKLNSGGVAMTVENPSWRSMGSAILVYCTWQSESGEVSSHGFPAEALTIVPDDKKNPGH